MMLSIVVLGNIDYKLHERKEQEIEVYKLYNRTNCKQSLNIVE